ncbi:MAG: BlaI/MecI/CopY family transcriptional regulator [Candidatus Palauibacterales bacterium]|nr:BlaI/MecI/CopY family transcriptional regulator [Candidatus Palauibacterales bacterium]
MSEPLHQKLSRREGQVMDAVYALGDATAREITEHLEDEEAYDSVRVITANLAKRGLLDREREGRSYRYRPAIPREKARRPEMSHLLETFFSDSPSRAVLAFLDMTKEELSREDLREISEWIDRRTGEGGEGPD